MSVQTQADEMLETAKMNILNAINNLNSICSDRDIWGADEYRDKYMLKMQKAVKKLLKAQSLLLGE